MKIRTNFVSNSSSSSFILDKNKLTEKQIGQIAHHTLEIQSSEYTPQEKEKIYCGSSVEELHGNAWDVEIKKDKIELFTWMDNFDMEEFLILIKADQAILKRD